MPKFRVFVERPSFERGYYVIEATDKKDALAQAEILFEAADPANMQTEGRSAESELLSEVEEISADQELLEDFLEEKRETEAAEAMLRHPATDIEAQLFVEELRLRAERYDLDAINELADLATKLLIACRKALQAAEEFGCRDAVEVLKDELNKLKLLPPENDE